MTNAHYIGKRRLRIGIVLALLCACTFASLAAADGMMPMMPEPPSTPVYWQLVRVDQEPVITPTGGYSVDYQANGLGMDLSDGLMAESVLLGDETATSGIHLTMAKSAVALDHTYVWTPLPIYLEPGVAYPIAISGSEAVGSKTMSSLLATYVQGERVSRISAGGYTGNPLNDTITISTDTTPLYQDGSLVISFVLRDVNDMFRLRVIYTYQMFGGIKPEPTPVPGFVAVDVPDGVVPSYYDAVPGYDGLWTVTTAADQYRAYGSMTGSEPMFFPADANGNVVMDEKPAQPQADYAAYVQGFVPVTPAEIPALYHETAPGIYTFADRDGLTVTRAYGRMDGGPAAFFPADALGVVAVDAQPTTPDADFAAYVAGFGSALPTEIPAHYQQAFDGLYAFTGRDGVTRYRAYGRLDGADPAFYPADETGAVETGAQSVLPEDDFANYIKGFDSTQPPSLPLHYTVVSDSLYAVTDRSGQPVYRVYGVLDGADPAFYPATADGKIVEEAQPVKPQADFEAYVAGFEPVALPGEDAPIYYYESETPGVWQFVDVNGETQYRYFGSLNRGEPAFYPSDAQGNVAQGALPVVPASDLVNMPPPQLVPAMPEAVPEWYEAVEGVEGLYTFTDRDGNPIYRMFGAYGRGKPDFYPADAEGNALENTDPVNPAEDFGEYFAGFEPEQPADLPSYYVAVPGQEGLYVFDRRDGGKEYRVYASKDRGEAAFYPADAQGTPLTLEPVDPNDDIPLLPTPYAALIITPGPAVTAGSTPLARTYDDIADWTVQGLVDPTPYAQNVLPVTTPETVDQTAVAREMATPDIIVDATPVSASVLPGTTPDSGDQTAVAREMATPGTIVDATPVNASVLPGTTPETGDQTAVAREVATPGTETPSPTDVGYSVTQPSPTEDAVPVVSRVEGTETPTSEATGTPVPSLTVAVGQTVTPTDQGKVGVSADPFRMDFTPTPAPAQTKPVELVVETQKGGTMLWVLVGVGVVAAGAGGYFLLRKKK